MANVNHIITKFGGVSAMARALGHKHPSTVQGWKEKGLIPSRRFEEVLNVAAAKGIDITPEDFIAHLRQHHTEECAA